MPQYDLRSFASLSHDRIKTLGQGHPEGKGVGFGAIGRWAHHVRSVNTPNAEILRRKHNRVWCADTNWIGMYFNSNLPIFRRILRDDYLAEVTRAKLKALQVGDTSKAQEGKLRSDCVYLEEILAWISPAWFRHGDLLSPVDEANRRSFEELTFEWLREKFKDNLLAVVSHADESNPHVGAFVIPILRKLITARGRIKAGETRKQWMGCVLRSDAFFSPDIHYKDGTVVQGKCSQNQTEYVQFLQQRGLDVERGIEQSKAEQRRMRTHAQAVHYSLPSLPVFRVLEIKLGETSANYLKRLKEDAGAQLENFNDALTVLYQKAAQHDTNTKLMVEYQMTAAEQRNLRELATAKLESLIKNHDSLIQKLHTLQIKLALIQSAQAQSPSFPSLETVAQILLPAHRSKIPALTPVWMLTDARQLTIKDEKFKLTTIRPDQPMEVLRGNSPLRLVQYVSRCTIEEAAAWLESSFGTEVMVQAWGQALKDERNQHLQSFWQTIERNVNDSATQTPVDALIRRRKYPLQSLRTLIDAGVLRVVPKLTGSILLQWWNDGKMARQDPLFPGATTFPPTPFPGLWVFQHLEVSTGAILVLPWPLDVLEIAAEIPSLLGRVNLILASSDEKLVLEYLRRTRLKIGENLIIACPWKDGAPALLRLARSNNLGYELINFSARSWAEVREGANGSNSKQWKPYFAKLEAAVNIKAVHSETKFRSR